jgi:hypothetical protein
LDGVHLASPATDPPREAGESTPPDGTEASMRSSSTTTDHTRIAGEESPPPRDDGGRSRRAGATMPSGISEHLSFFDRFASTVSGFVSRAWFFLLCVLLVLVWAPSYFLFGSADTWQLIINTVTTIVTFLLVALLQNTQKRTDDASQKKLNAIAEGLSDLMEKLAADHPDLRDDRKQLRAAVGLEDRESAED